MLTRVFLLLVVLAAIAVQAAPNNHFISPEKAASMESNDLKTFLQVTGSGGTSTSTGVDSYSIYAISDTEVQIDFDASGLTYYYFMVKDSSESTPTVPSPTDCKDFAGVHIAEGFVNGGDADGPASLILDTGGLTDTMDIYVCSVYDSVVYPTSSVAAQTLVNSFKTPPSISIEAVQDSVGDVAVSINSNAQGTVEYFSYQCCDLMIRAGVKCKEASINVCSPANKLLAYQLDGTANLPSDTITAAETNHVQTYVAVPDDLAFGGNFTEFMAQCDGVTDPCYTYVAIHVVFTNDVGDVYYFTQMVDQPDVTPPVWDATLVITTTVTEDSISLDSVKVDDAAEFYTMATLVGATTPTAEEIIANGNMNLVVSGLLENTAYEVHIVAVSDISGNSDVVSIAATTADVTSPILESFIANLITRDGADVTVQCDETCYSYYIISSGDVAPTFSEISTSADTVIGDGSTSIQLADLQPDTTYFLSMVIYDDAGNTDGIVKTISFTTESLVVYNTNVYLVDNDASIVSWTNLGNDATLEVTPTTGALISAGVPVDASGIGSFQSTLTFYGGVDGDVYTLSLMNTAWTEYGATSLCAAYLNKCVNANWDLLNADGSIASTGITATVVDGKLVFDVTDDINAILAGADNFGWFLSGDQAGTFSSSEGANGPELAITYQEDVTVGQNSFGPVCEHDDISIVCDTGVININSASYGRHNNFQCPYSGGDWAMQYTQCHSENSMSVLSTECNGKTSCSMTIENGAFGDPCQGTYKYMEGAYTCLSSNGNFCSGFIASASQAACVSSQAGAVYTCNDGFSGSACEIENVDCAPLVLHLSFDDEYSTDSSCNANVGTDVNGVTYMDGVTGRAAVYGTVDEQYAHVADSAVLQLTEEFTACLWVNADKDVGVKNGHTNVLLSQGVMGAAGSDHTGFGIYINNDNKYQTGARISVRFEQEKRRTSLEQEFTIDGNWHFVCAVFSEAKQSLFVDNIVVTETRHNKNGPLKASTGGIYVGTDFQSSKYQSHAAIDEVKIYNVALSQDEVSEIFSADGGIGATTGFFEAEDTVVEDDDLDHVVLNAGSAGCSDGTREGFLEQTSIAACAGAWSVPGVATVDSFDKQCEGTTGQGCSVADICAVGWHVCYDAAEVLDKSDGLGCNGVSDFSEGFFVSRQSGNGNINMVSTGTNDVFGCGEGASIGSSNEAQGLNAFTHNKCNGVDSSWACKGNGQGLDEALTITHDSNIGGAMCCRDDRKKNCGQQKSGAKQVEVKVKKSTGQSHKDDEDCKAIGQAIESEVCKKSGKSCKIKAVRKRSGSSNKSNKSKASRGGHRRLLQTADEPQYTYIVYEVIPGATSDGNELTDIQSVITSEDSALNTDFVGVEGYSELHSCDDGTMQASCDSVVVRETTALPAGSVGAGYGETESTMLGNSSDIVNAVIVTASVFVLLIVSGFAYRAHTAKSVDKDFDARIMNSTQQSSDVEMTAAKGGEQDTYWVFNKQTDGQDVRVVV